jgi:hypothetical protein
MLTSTSASSDFVAIRKLELTALFSFSGANILPPCSNDGFYGIFVDNFTPRVLQKSKLTTK